MPVINVRYHSLLCCFVLENSKMTCECVDAKGRCSHTMVEETVELHDHYLPCDWEHICLLASGRNRIKIVPATCPSG